MSNVGTITIDPKNTFRKHVDRLAREYGLTAKQLMQDQMRLLSTGLIKDSPPKSKTQAAKAIRADLDRIFVGMTAMERKTARAMGGAMAGKYRVENKNGAAWLVEEALFSRTASQHDLRSWHQQKRSGNTGRVSRSGMGGRSIGRWRSIPKMHVQKTALNTYTKHVIARAGRLKKGWLPAVHHWRGKAPQWVLKSRAPAEGRWVDRMMDSGSGYLEAINYVPYGSKHLASIVAINEGKRRMDISGKLELRIKKVAAKFNAA